MMDTISSPLCDFKVLYVLGQFGIKNRLFEFVPIGRISSPTNFLDARTGVIKV